ncbi:MAG: 5-formyltetrahydrofolate cyclo-ligase [Candidatus Omnitrophota bacterium]|nr:MAG: 5-formyltetrahydrofolate cyclo-ligase [Candidatus Omnitrophota bacterium]RKY35828.1 MAG: 5-formyltetrahydrofolate cyclo-ligase [Candidatus Omnitrophota bacterium]RKY44632.1 MAG: 5-formyltetrahydrofolate cyclo-ligase [Candidatus Omnitrophota bacterium]
MKIPKLMLKYPSNRKAPKLKEPICEEKQRLRKKIKTLLKGLSSEEKQKRSKLIEKRIENLDCFKLAEVIMFYWPLPGEPDVKGLIRKAKNSGKAVVLPLIEKDSLVPYKFTSSQELRMNSLGVCQPPKKKELRLDRRELDLVVVPGLAFDKENRRLGRGKGYYDRFLKTLLPKTLKIGVAFSEQIFERLPSSLQDEKVDLVVWA